MKYRVTGFLIGVAALILATTTVFSLPAKVDFSGTWTLDKSASVGIPDEILGMTLVVKQTGDKIDLEGTITTDQGDEKLPDSILVDGKLNDYTPRGPGGITGTGKRTAKWSADGKSLESVEDATFTTGDGDVKIHTSRSWALSDDGKKLTIDQTITGIPGATEAQHVKRVMIKK